MWYYSIGMQEEQSRKYDASKMVPEVLYKFQDSVGVEIAAYLNAEKDSVIWWYTAELTADESTWNNKHYDSVSLFTRRLNTCGLVHTN